MNASTPAPTTVLIVDDDRWVARSLASVIATTPGMRLLGAVHSGEEAVAAYRQERPDVVLMDVNMGSGMTGVDATAEIVRADPEARIVVLTTIAPGPGLTRALDAGAVAALNKSASEVTLIETVRGAARGEDPSMLKNLVGDVLVSGEAHPEMPDAAPQLTAAERETLWLICDGHGYAEIAARRGVEVSTVKAQAKQLREKLGAQNLAQLVVRAIQYSYISA